MLVLLFVNSFYVLSNDKKNLKLLESNLSYSVNDLRNTLFYTTCTKMIIEIYNNYHFDAKFSLNLEIKPNSGKINKRNTLQISENFIFCH